MFEDNPYIDVDKENPDGESAYHLYPILLKEKYANQFPKSKQIHHQAASG